MKMYSSENLEDGDYTKKISLQLSGKLIVIRLKLRKRRKER